MNNSEKENKKNNLIKKIKNNKIKSLIILVSLIIILGIIIVVIKNINSDEIKKVSKILPSKYYAIDCLDSNCDGIAAYKGNKTGKSVVTLLDGNGNKVAKYKDIYNSNAKVKKEPYELGKDYFIFKKVNSNTNKVKGYSIANKKGKETYSTENRLKVLNDNLILMDDVNKSIKGYSILNSKGKILLKNINDYEVYANGKVIFADVEGTKEILDEKGKILLTDYFVATDIYDENDELLYLLVEDSKNNAYNYFSIKDLKIIGDSFQNYIRNNDGTLTITKKENNSTVKYLLYKDGKQKLIGEDKTQSEIASELKKNIDTKKYNLYLTSIYDENQKYIFADDLTNKAFGIYEIKSNKFKKIYDYKKDSSNLYSSISKINNDKNINYYQVSCSAYNCSKNEFYVYDLEQGKELYKVSDSKLKVQNYYQYEDDYKVVKYSYSTQDNNYKGKYALYDKNNKEITKSSNNIVVIDKKLLIGSEFSSSLILYSVKSKKVLNTEKTLGTKIILDNNNYYRYQTNDNTILLNEDGKEVLKIDSLSDIIYSDKVLVYIKDRKIYIFDVNSGKTRKYKLKENEKMNDAMGDLISPYRGALFINNSSNNYVKIVNSKGNIIKTIKKAEIMNIHKTSDNNVVIIIKNDTKKTITYGLYIAK